MVSVVDAAQYEPSADPEVSFFQELVRHKTISSEAPKTGAYRECIAFLNERCQRIGLKTKVVEFVQGKPVLLATRVGTCPELPAVLLNSHYDVVPVMAEHWDVPAFEAIIKDGKVWGRGTQDMKCVVAQYILAMERLRDAELQRTVHLSFVPDEEIGGADGMGRLVNSLEFKALGEICIALDEGLANEQNAYTVFYGERAPLWILVKSEGPTGHGSRFIADTAVSKLIGVANKALEFRSKEESKLGYSGGCKHCNAKKLGDVTTLNLTMLKTGVSSDEGKTYALNVIPTCAEAGFDVRVPTSVPCQDIEAMLDDWCKEEGLSWKYAPWAGTPITEHYVSSIDEKTSPFWATILKTFQDEFGLKIEPEVFPAGTDSRFLRENGIPSYGFSPMKNSPILLHEHNEYLDISVFKEGISVYTTLLPRLANLIP